MGLIALKCLLYILVGLIQEMFIVVYHRATSTGRKHLVVAMTICITIISVMVTAQIIHQMLDVGGLISFLFVTAFACGKGMGAYIALGWWDKIHGGKENGSK